MGGLVVLVTTGKNPLETYKAIFEGSGLNWLFPWVTGQERVLAGFNLQQTLIATTTFILVGLAVAFAFRCGLFNIGGQGQYLSGAILAVWVGSSFEGMTPVLHIVLAIVVGTAMGALIGGIAGFLKATVGAHEVISTIMLNWTVLWVGVFLFGLGGPLQNDLQVSVPISNDILESAKLRVFWATRSCRGSTSGSSSRSPRSSSTGSSSTGRRSGTASRPSASTRRRRATAASTSRATTSSPWRLGAFAGLAGAIDILGWQFRLSTGDIQTSAIGFTGIAVALLGRNTAVGVASPPCSSARCSRARRPETSIRRSSSRSRVHLTLLIQGLVVLFVGMDMVVLWLLGRARRRKVATA